MTTHASPCPCTGSGPISTASRLAIYLDQIHQRHGDLPIRGPAAVETVVRPAYGTITRSTNCQLGPSPSVDEASAIGHRRITLLRFPSHPSPRLLPPCRSNGNASNSFTRQHRATRGSPLLSQRSAPPWLPHPLPGTRSTVGSERTKSWRRPRRRRRRPKRRYSRFCFLHAHARARSSGSIFGPTAFGLVLALRDGD